MGEKKGLRKGAKGKNGGGWVQTSALPPLHHTCAGGKEVVISRKAGEAVLRGAPIYVPGVLACSSGVEAGDLVAVSVALERPGR
jgi:predicted ribosome-associated RNA-binding protein Tma20